MQPVCCGIHTSKGEAGSALPVWQLVEGRTIGEDGLKHTDWPRHSHEDVVICSNSKDQSADYDPYMP